MFRNNFRDLKHFVTVQIVRSREATPNDYEEMEEEDDDDGDDDSYEMGLDAISSKKDKKFRVTIRVDGSNEIFDLLTRKFVWPFPWIKYSVAYDGKDSSKFVAVKALKEGNFTVVSARLQEVGSSFIKSFLASLHMHEIETAQRFIEHCNLFGNARLSRIKQLLASYTKKYSHDDNAIKFARDVTNFMVSKWAGKVLTISLEAPDFFRHGPLLFSRKIPSMLSSSSNDKCIAPYIFQLDRIIRESPVKLAFSSLLYKELEKSYGLEVGLMEMKLADFYDSLTDLEKDCIHVYTAIKRICNDLGHVYLFEWDIFTSCYLTEKRQPFYKITRGNDQIMEYLSSEIGVLKMEENEEGISTRKRYFLMKHYRHELNIKSKIKELLENENAETFALDFENEDFERIRQDSGQRVAAQLCAEKPVVMVTGRGGTGKTEVVSVVIRHILRTLYQSASNAQSQREVLENQALDKVLCVAPTGKAVSGMKKRSKMSAYTIHSVLASLKHYLIENAKTDTKGKSANPEAAWKFSEVRVVAIDESSMVSPELLSSFLNAMMSHTKLEKLIFLGDIDQLPSIQPGNLMEDLHEVLLKLGNVAQLKTNHRSEGHLIFNNAERIRNQRMPIFNKQLGFHFIHSSIEENDNPSVLISEVTKLQPIACPKDLFTFIDDYKDKVPREKQDLYSRLMRNHTEDFGLYDAEKSQMIAFKNVEGKFFNEIATQRYNKHRVKELEPIRPGHIKSRWCTKFSVGDKIMVTKNNDVGMYENSNSEVMSTNSSLFSKVGVDRLCNGSVYMIRNIIFSKVKVEKEDGQKDSKSEPEKEKEDQFEFIDFFELDDLDGSVIYVNSIEFKRKSRPSHAYGCTIHKFQGSESDHVLYGLSTSYYETWRHVYTAVTRAKKSIAIFGDYKSLCKAVQRCPIKRQTRLKERFFEDDLLFLSADDSLNFILSQDHNLSQSVIEFEPRSRPAILSPVSGTSSILQGLAISEESPQEGQSSTRKKLFSSAENDEEEHSGSPKKRLFK